MGEPKIILQYGTSEGLTSEAQRWMGVLGCAGESPPCGAAAKSGKRSFELILCKGVLSVSLFHLCSTSLKSFQVGGELCERTGFFGGAGLSFFPGFGVTRLFPPAALIVWLGPKPGPYGIAQ